MDKLLEMFEKALAEYQASIDKKDTLVGTGEIIVLEFRKQRDQIVTLSRLLSDFYATCPADQKAFPASAAERAHINEARGLGLS